MKRFLCAVAILGLWVSPGRTADRPEAEEVPFEQKLRELSAETDGSGKLSRARDMIRAHRFSSLQVKAIAARLSDDNARLEFATAAYPRTVDPENFYEVYDAFTTFSKVMRLHDRIHQFERVRTPPPIEVRQTVTDQEFREMLRAVKRESFDNTRKQLAQQIIGNSRKLFLSAQVKQIVDAFDFEPTKLEMAKYAYEYTFDKEKYFLVNEAFSFDQSKQELARYIQSSNDKARAGNK